MSIRGSLLWAAVGTALAAAALLPGWPVRRVAVEGRSMEPALLAGDRLIVVPRTRVRRGDVVMVREPGDAGVIAVKRVAGLPGDAVVAADGSTLEGDPGYALLGDNLELSVDSRRYGRVPPAAILGRAVFRYSPGPRRGRL